ncbi:MAG: hypothetical protein AAF517_05500 [Planctomycetota bacterium]
MPASAVARFESALRLSDSARQLLDENPAGTPKTIEAFRKAGAEFERAWELGARTTAVATNAANCYFFAGDIGESVLYYRRAQALDPANSELGDALEHIRSTLPIQKRANTGNTNLADALFFWHDERYFLLRTWIFYLFFPAAWILFAVEIARRRLPASKGLLVLVLPWTVIAWLLSYLFRVRRPYAAVGFISLLPALASLTSLLVEARVDRSIRAGVVVAETQGRNGDGESYQPSHSGVFPVGTELKVIESRDSAGSSWHRVELLDASDAWVPASAVEFVIPR